MVSNQSQKVKLVSRMQVYAPILPDSKLKPKTLKSEPEEP